MEAPVFVVKPVNKDVKEDAKATFECKVKGKPAPESSPGGEIDADWKSKVT